MEVTSSVDLLSCKKVMDTLIQKSIEAGLSSVFELSAGPSEVKPAKEPGIGPGIGPGMEASAEGEQIQHQLVIQQVRVVSEDGLVKVAYPSRVDLQFESVKVVYEEQK